LQAAADVATDAAGAEDADFWRVSAQLS